MRHGASHRPSPGKRHPVARRWAHWLGRNLARLHYARHVEPTWLEVNNHRIPIRDLPAAFQGFRIVQISDMHVGPKLTAHYLDEIVDSVLAEQPDLIALTGDFIHKGFRHVSRAARSISRLKAPHGVFAVLGNHDFSVRNALGLRRHRHLHRAVATALSDVGTRVLRNESIVLRLGDAAVDLVGVDDLWSGECDLDAAYGDHDPRRPRLVLAHNPRTIEGLDGRRCDLMLSGHTHGGQVNLPKLGRVTLSKKSRRFAAGLYTVDSTVLYVNKGVGFGWRFRYGVRPEIAVLMLDRA
jgi:uncharacterized protein